MQIMKNWINKLNYSDSILSKSYRKQFAVTFIVNIITFSHGVGVGWLSPTLLHILSEDNPVEFDLTLEQASWIGSLLGIGSVVGNVGSGFLSTFAGQKITLYWLAIPHSCLWILIYFAQNPYYLYVARAAAGISGGGCYTLLPVFVSEIADAKIRGTLSSMLMFSVNIGILVGFILGSHLEYSIVPRIVIILPILYFILIFFFPASPQYLLRQGDSNAAEKSLQFYKNIDEKSTFTERLQCSKEFNELKMASSQADSSKKPLVLRDFVTCDALKAFATAAVLLIVNQFCGNFAFINYMSQIFAKSGSNMDPNNATIIVGVSQILGSFSAFLACDRYGRKMLMLLSTGGAAIVLTLFGLHSYYADHYDLSHLSWMPVVLMSLNVYICTIGLVSMFFVILVEIFPAKIRAISVSICTAVLSLMVFAVLKIFPLFLEGFGVAITMWCCAGVCAFGYVYMLIFLQETNGKSMLN